MSNQQKQVKNFKKKYKLKRITGQGLINVLSQQGYSVIEYDECYNPDLELLSSSLQIKAYLEQSKCFTYQDNNYRLVFLNKHLNEQEKIIVLSHEEGHIWNKHLAKQSIFGEDVIQEHEANEFAHYLLLDVLGKKKKTRNVIVCSVLLAVVITIALWIGVSNYNQKTYVNDCYVTEGGQKYHKKNCIYIRDKKNVKKLTKEDYENKQYEPCEVCIPID